MQRHFDFLHTSPVVAFQTGKNMWFRLLGSVAGAFLLLVVRTSAYPLYYAANDDYIMTMMLRGAYGTADGILVYPLYFFSEPLRLLYRWFPGVAWFPLVLLFLFGCSFSVFFFLAANIRAPFAVLSGVMGCLVLLELECTMLFTYTVVAFLCAGSGIALLIGTLFSHPYTARRMRGLTLCSACLLAAGVCIRKESAFSALAVFAPVYMAGLLHRRQTGKRLVAAGIAVLVGCAGLVGANALIFRSHTEWTEYLAYNKVRTQIMDYRHADISEAQKAGVNLSENDLQTLYQGIYEDKSVFSTETLRALGNAIPLTQKYKLDLSSTYDKPWLIFELAGTAAVVFFLLLFSPRRRGYWKRYISVLAVCGGLFFTLLLTGRTLSRVTFPVFLLTVVALFMCSPVLSFRMKKLSPNKRRVFFLGVSALLCTVAVLMIRAQILPLQKSNQTEIKTLSAPVLAYLDNHPDTVVLSASTGVVFIHQYDVFALQNISMPRNYLCYGTWSAFSPYRDVICANNGLSLISPLQDLGRSGRVCILTNDARSIQLIQTFLSEHLGKTFVPEPVDTFPGSGYQIIRFSSAG